MPCFWGLLRETHDLVYRYALPTDQEVVIEPSNGSPDTLEPCRLVKPLADALLRVSNVIHNESTLVLYGDNQYRLPESLPPRPGSIFVRYAPLFRHVNVYYYLRTISDSTIELSISAPQPKSTKWDLPRRERQLTRYERPKKERPRASFTKSAHKRRLLRSLTGLESVKY